MRRNNPPPTPSGELIERIAAENGDYVPDWGGSFIFSADPDSNYSIYTFARSLVLANETTKLTGIGA